MPQPSFTLITAALVQATIISHLNATLMFSFNPWLPSTPFLTHLLIYFQKQQSNHLKTQICYFHSPFLKSFSVYLNLNSETLTHSTKSSMSCLLPFTAYPPTTWIFFLPALLQLRTFTHGVISTQNSPFKILSVTTVSVKLKAKIRNPTQRNLLSFSYLNEVPIILP